MKKIIVSMLFFICIFNLIACTKATPHLETNEPNKKNIEIKKNKYEIAGIDNPIEFEKNFNKVKVLVAKDNKKEVANYIIYPLRVNSEKEKITIENKEDFIKNYDNIFTEKVKTALKAQNIEDTFVNYQGVMVGNGEIWFGASELNNPKYGIIAINK